MSCIYRNGGRQTHLETTKVSAHANKQVGTRIMQDQEKISPYLTPSRARTPHPPLQHPKEKWSRWDNPRTRGCIAAPPTCSTNSSPNVVDTLVRLIHWPCSPLERTHRSCHIAPRHIKPTGRAREKENEQPVEEQAW